MGVCSYQLDNGKSEKLLYSFDSNRDVKHKLAGKIILRYLLCYMQKRKCLLKMKKEINILISMKKSFNSSSSLVEVVLTRKYS